ncbi:MAG: hypothetical protein ABI778_08235 [Ignavibacteriota bacterium]
MKQYTFFVVAGFVLYLCGCAYDPSEPGLSKPGKTIPPASGSAFTYENIPIDTNGVEHPDSSYFSIVAIADSGITYAGKTNVTHLTTLNLKDGSSGDEYVAYESNGGISFYTGASIFSFIGLRLPDWNTFPVQTKVTSGAKVADTNISFNAIPIAVKGYDTTNYIGSANTKVSGKDIAIINMKHSLTFNCVATLIIQIPFNVFIITTASIAPSIGYYTNRVNEPVKIPVPGFPSFAGLRQTLVSYHLN